MLTRFPLAFATENGVNGGTTGLLNLEDFVGHRCIRLVINNDSGHERTRRNRHGALLPVVRTKGLTEPHGK